MKKTKEPVKNLRQRGDTITDCPPAWLSQHAKDVWRETIATLEAEGKPLGMANLQAFTAFADAAGLVRECAEVLARDGMTIDGGREGLKRHPAVTTRISALNALKGLAVELGLTPGSAKKNPGPSPEDLYQRDFVNNLRRNDPHGLERFIKTHGREPENEFDYL